MSDGDGCYEEKQSKDEDKEPYGAERRATLYMVVREDLFDKIQHGQRAKATREAGYGDGWGRAMGRP